MLLTQFLVKGHGYKDDFKIDACRKIVYRVGVDLCEENLLQLSYQQGCSSDL